MFKGQFSRKLPQNIQRVAERKLIMLHRSVTLDDLRTPPANRLEALKVERSGQHSVRINNQWRINRIVRGERGISADTAIRLARYFGMSVEFWTGIQTHYEVEMAKMALGDQLDTEVKVFQ